MGKDQEIDRKIVAGASSQNEEMPDGMVKKEAFPGVKDQTETVKESTSHKEVKAGSGNQFHQRLSGEHDQPAHEKVEQRGKDLEPVDEKNLEQDPEAGQPPDRAKQGPAPVTAQVNQGKRGVRPRDEKVNGRMVENFEDPSPALVKLVDMIEGEDPVGNDQGGPENGEAHDMPDVTVPNRVKDQSRQPRDSQQEPGGRRENVEDLGGSVVAFVHTIGQTVCALNAGERISMILSKDSTG